MNLDEAIGQLITLGEKDPVEIARKVEQRHGSEWLASELLAHAESIVAEVARKRLGAERRAAVVKIEPRTVADVGEVKTKSVWIPDLLAPGVGGHKRMADCTPEEFERRAGWLDRLASSVSQQAGWFRDLAARMRDEGARTFKGFKGELPTLPPDELGAA